MHKVSIPIIQIHLETWTLPSNEEIRGALQIRQLSYFLTLAQYGSISAAANALNMAQPSLSENIAKLEKQLDVQLAIRGTRGVQLTEAGMKLVERGTNILQSVEDLVSELRNLSSDPRGPVSIAFPPALGLILSVPLLETINNEHQDIRMHISEAMSGDILEWVENERIDFGCAYEVASTAPYMSVPLLTEEMFLVTAPDNWDDKFIDGVAAKPIKASQIESLPLVLTSPSHGARKIQDKFAKAGGFQYNIIATIDSLPQIVEMVSRASAYSILPHGAVMKQVAAGDVGLVRIVEPTIFRTAYIVRKRSRPITQAGIIAEEAIKSVVAEMIERYNIQATVPNP